MPQTAFTVFCALAIPILILPAGWYLKHRHIGVLAYIVWTLVAVVPSFINSIIWRNNVDNIAPVWCDITTKLALGATIGIACADLSNSRYIYLIASSKIVHVDRRRRAIVEAALCFGIPIIWMVLHVVTQGHRFDIIEGFGCQVTVYFTWLAIIVVHLPLATSVVAAVYCALAMKHLIQQRRELSQLVSNHSSALSVSRFIRLLALTSVIIVVTIPLQTFLLYTNLSGGVHPYISWANVHEGFGFVLQVTEAELAMLPNSTVQGVYVGNWMYPVAGLVFFVFFGVNTDLKEQYSRVARWIAVRLGVKTSFAAGTTYDLSGSFPGSKTSASPLTSSRNHGLSAVSSFDVKTPGTEKDLEKEAGQDSGCSELEFVDEFRAVEGVHSGGEGRVGMSETGHRLS